jgi:16S rRNA G966 N2-methylase RsmD
MVTECHETVVNHLNQYIDENKDLNVDELNWATLNKLYTQSQLSHAIVELKHTGALRPPAPLLELNTALADFQSLKSLVALSLVQNLHFDTKYEVPLSQRLGILSGNTTGNVASDYFHYALRSRVGDYHSNRGITVRWERMKHGDSNFLSAIWSLKLKKLTRITLLAALRMRLVLVPQFRPATAKALYTLYGGGDVLDFCGGWGDRLAGAAACYPLVTSFTVVEPRPEAAALYAQQLVHYAVDMPLIIYTECAENVLSSLSDRSFDIIFTSPPYFDCEHYGDVTNMPETQSHRKFRKFDAWLTGFLFCVVEQRIRLLKSGGTLILNVNDIIRRKTRHYICKELLNYVQRFDTVHYVGVWGYPMAQRMGRNLQAQHNKTQKVLRTEPIYIWRKL